MPNEPGEHGGQRAPSSLPPLLRIPYQAFIARLHAELATAGYPEIRPTHGLVFQHLRAEGARVTELAERSQVSKQWMGSLTDEGRQLLRTAEAISRRIEAEWAERVGERRVLQLRRRLEDVIGGLGLE